MLKRALIASCFNRFSIKFNKTIKLANQSIKLEKLASQSIFNGAFMGCYFMYCYGIYYGDDNGNLVYILSSLFYVLDITMYYCLYYTVLFSNVLTIQYSKVSCSKILCSTIVCSMF